MTAVTLVLADLAPFADIEPVKAQAMIDDALAMAERVAPCITEETFAYAAAAKAILRGAIIRWADAGSGALASEQTTRGPFGYAQTIDTRQQRRGMFWPSEIEQLQELCTGSESSGAFAIDTVSVTGAHADSCALNFGALYCSCGYDIAGYPIFGV